MKQKNHHFTGEVTIQAPAALTWAALTEVRHWPRWDTELASATLAGDFESGAVGTLQPKTGPRLKFELLDVNAPNSYTVSVMMPVGRLVMRRSLRGVDGGLLFTDEIFFTGPLRIFWGLLLGRGFRKSLPDVLKSFVAFVHQKISR